VTAIIPLYKGTFALLVSVQELLLKELGCSVKFKLKMISTIGLTHVTGNSMIFAGSNIVNGTIFTVIAAAGCA